MNLDGLSLRPLVTELSAKITGSRVDRIFQPDGATLLFWLRQPGENLALMLSANPERAGVYLATAIPDNPPVPTGFCMLLRKHFEDGRLVAVEQRGLDRVVTLSVDIRGERGRIVTKQLVIEIMGKHSNIIFVQDGIVVDAIKRVGAGVSRLRQVLPGREYAPPPGQVRLNPLATASADFIDFARRTPEPGQPLAKAIVAAAEGLGPLTAKEIIWRAGLPPDIAAGALDAADAAALAEAAASVFEPLKSGAVTATVALSSGRSRLLGLAAFRPEHLADHELAGFAAMSAAVEFAVNFKGRPDNPEKTVLLKLVASELARLNRKTDTLARELAEAEAADTLRQSGDILMTHLYVIPAGAAEVTLPNLFAEEPEETVTIALNPQASPVANAQHYYTRYTKAKRAQESLAGQLRECREELAYLDTVAVALEQAVTFDDAAEIRQELVQAGYIRENARKRAEPPAAPLQGATSGGLSLLVGRNNRQNDLVTFKHAQAEDLWFHTKDTPGSHVILRTGGGEPPPEALAEAAMLAAYYSKARRSSSVPVDYTRRRYVKKPSGAKPGFVIYDHQKTVYVTPDETKARELLAKKRSQ